MEVLHISPNQSKSWENLVIAGLAQLVERQFPKLKVAGSRPVARSSKIKHLCAFCARSRQRNQPKSPKSVQFH